VFADSLIPAQIVARGSGLDSAHPSYYALALTRGLEAQLGRVSGGAATVLGSVRSSSWLSGVWVEATLDIQGSTLRAQLYRPDTRQYLDAQGRWQSSATWAIEQTDTGITAPGQVGLGRPGSYTGTIHLDDFRVYLPTVVESFDQTPAGSLPAGWTQWSNTGSAVFAVASGTAFSAPNALAATAATSTTAARTWPDTLPLADLQASAVVHIDSLIPAQVFGRGTRLASGTPSYYAVSVTRGLQVQLVRVQNGVATVLGQVASRDWVDNVWVRVTLHAIGTNVRAQVYRLDRAEYLDASGNWQETPAWAVNLTDAAVPGPGLAGLARPASYTGTIRFDDFAVLPANGDSDAPFVAITSPAPSATLSGIVQVEADVHDNIGVTKVEFDVDGIVRAVATSGPFRWDLDTRTLANGEHSFTVLAQDAAGNAGRATILVTTRNDNTVTQPVIPRHYPHIRIAQLAYAGTPLGTFEDDLLRSSVDLVIPDVSYLRRIDSVSPDTPQLLYTNASTLYLDRLTDWLTYADAHGVSRETAFYHVNRATAFTGNSPSSRPVNRFWRVYRGSADLTSRAYGGTPGGVTFGAVGESLAIGYPERFREINLTLRSGASGGWSSVIEYATQVDAAGRPTAWAPLRVLGNTTAGLTRSGQVLFDPPADWKPASLNGTARLYYVRFRTTASGTAPVAAMILGRDYVQAQGTTSGTIPAFDHAADLNGDGYLTDAEYVRSAAGKDARFIYETRAFYGTYGQMRFASNPADPTFRDWLIDYHQRVLRNQPLTDGFFVDNSDARTPVAVGGVHETVGAFADDYGALLSALARAIAPRWLLANTAGGGKTADSVVRQNTGYYEEFFLRPLAHTYAQFEDVAAQVARRQALQSPQPYAVLDSLPTGGSPTDARTQIATLAYYYLLADPQRTFLNFYGGHEPGTSWTRHWSPAAAYNIGPPQGGWSLFTTGADPSDPALTYRVYQRSYTNALVLYKPLSAGSGRTGTLAGTSATTHVLNGPYAPLRADGTLGPSVTSVTLRNGEGAVLIRV
jgi:hypothetical protein